MGVPVRRHGGEEESIFSFAGFSVSNARTSEGYTHASAAGTESIFTPINCPADGFLRCRRRRRRR